MANAFSEIPNTGGIPGSRLRNCMRHMPRLMWMTKTSELPNLIPVGSFLDPYISYIEKHRVNWVRLRFTYEFIAFINISRFLETDSVWPNKPKLTQPWVDPFNFGMPVTWRTPLKWHFSHKIIPKNTLIFPYLPINGEWQHIWSNQIESLGQLSIQLLGFNFAQPSRLNGNQRSQVVPMFIQKRTVPAKEPLNQVMRNKNGLTQIWEQLIALFGPFYHISSNQITNSKKIAQICCNFIFLGEFHPISPALGLRPSNIELNYIGNILDSLGVLPGFRYKHPDSHVFTRDPSIMTLGIHFFSFTFVVVCSSMSHQSEGPIGPIHLVHASG